MFTEYAVIYLVAGCICGGGDVQDGGVWKWCGRPAFGCADKSIFW